MVPHEPSGSLTIIETEIDQAKTQLNTTVTNLSQQEREATSANNRVRELSQEEDDLNAKLAEVENIIGGKRIITVDDLENSNREGQIDGAVIGFLITVIGAYIYDRMKEFFKVKVLG